MFEEDDDEDKDDIIDYKGITGFSTNNKGDNMQ